MTPIDYLLLAGAAVAGGYVVARLFVGWFRSSTDNRELERNNRLNAPVVGEPELEPVEKTDAPWHFWK